MHEHAPDPGTRLLSTPVSRRDVLRAAAASTGTIVLASPTGRAETATPQPGGSAPYIRRDVHRLPEGSTLLESYARGIGAMRERDEMDPTSWVFQARIHGVPEGVDPRGDVTWASCPHGSVFFLPWHRMYLYWFERILRKASGDPAFALPYWNYGQPNQQVLPEPFRLPAEESNHLYVPARNPAVNAGEPPLFQVFDPFNQQVITTFAALLERAISLLPDTPFDMSSALEFLPHDIVHGWVGGRFAGDRPGWMGSTATAALDPVFWMHHANIDRLWKRWLDLGGVRQYPEDPRWRDRVSAFYDDDGDLVEMTNAEILDTVEALEYGYDDDPPASEPDATPVISTPVATPGATPAVGVATPSLAASGEGPFEVGAEGASISFEVGADDPGARTAAEAPLPTRITLDGVAGAGVPGVMNLVFINLPPGEPADPASPYFAGGIILFGFQPWDSMGEDHGEMTNSQSIDISRNIAELQARGEWEGVVEVTVVPVDLMPTDVSLTDEGGRRVGPEATPAADLGTPFVFIEQVTVST